MVEPPPSVVSIVAPPGYGKTTLLAEWARRADRSVAWLTLDVFDNEPSVFLSYLAAAIDRIRPIDGSLASALSVPGTGILGSGVPRLAAELHGWPRPGLLILDDLHLLVDRTCLDALTALLEHLPPGFQVAFAGRTTPDLPLARLRARQGLLEVGRGDLAFGVDETARVVAAAGQGLSPDQARHLADRTEGWPAAIYLAALAGRAGGAMDGATGAASSRDGYIADYLRSELNPTLADEDLAVLTRASILDVLEVPALAAVTALPGAGDRLRALARRNELIVRLGGSPEAYRYHLLLRDYLRAELDRREPGAAAGLHRRAARWFADAGRLEEAIEHAFAGGDPDATARLVEQAFLATYYGGHADRLGRWLRSLDVGVFEQRPSLAIAAAWLEALTGNPGSADRMADLGERSTFTGTPADGTASFESSRAMLRAAIARNGPDDILENATFAAAAEGTGSRWRATALWLLGGAHLLRGDLDAADAVLAEAVDAAPGVGTSGFYALALRASLAIARGDWRAAEELARESQAGFERTNLDGVLSALMVHAVAARVAIHHGDLARGREELVHAQLLRPLASYALPWRPPSPCSSWDERTWRSATRREPAASSPMRSASFGSSRWASSRRRSRSCGAGWENLRDDRRAFDPHPGRASRAPVPLDAPDVRGDRRTAARLPSHGEDTLDLHLREARRIKSRGGRGAGGGGRPARAVFRTPPDQRWGSDRERCSERPAGWCGRGGGSACGPSSSPVPRPPQAMPRVTGRL